MRGLKIIRENFDLHSNFAISRSANHSINVVTVEIGDGTFIGRGECRPYPRYNETPESVTEQINAIKEDIENGLSRLELLTLLSSGAARNAVDCALWDLEAKQQNTSVWKMIGGHHNLQPVPTVQSLSMASPQDMAKSATQHLDYKTLKIKLGGDPQDMDRLKAIRQARPDAALVIDANEGWTFEQLKRFVDQAQNLGVTMIEQPLPRDEDDALFDYDSGSIRLCGDESIHNLEDIETKAELYDMMNIKLDKSGGLTHALEMTNRLKQLNQRGKNIQLMVGCMVCTSLAIAPHIILAQQCDLADLDGPWWLKEDRAHGVQFSDGKIFPTTIWG